jgi:DNA-binding IclR family transcriptional regulator
MSERSAKPSQPSVDALGMRESGGVQVIRRAASILQALKDEQDGLSLSQIASRVGLARSTVHRLISALETEHFVVAVSPSGRFRLGPGLVSLALTAQRELALEIHPFLHRLARETNETVDLAVLEHDYVLFVDQVVGQRRLRAVSAVGAVFPAHCTANGKALLARLPDEQLLRLLPERLERLTPHTIDSRSQLLEEIERIRKDGVAYDREEHTLGICAVGAVVVDGDERLAAVTIPLPVQRFYGNERPLTEALLRTCAEIEQALAPE